MENVYILEINRKEQDYEGEEDQTQTEEPLIKRSFI